MRGWKREMRAKNFALNSIASFFVFCCSTDVLSICWLMLSVSNVAVNLLLPLIDLNRHFYAVRSFVGWFLVSWFLVLFVMGVYVVGWSCGWILDWSQMLASFVLYSHLTFVVVTTCE
jgi:hypothetical protein